MMSIIWSVFMMRSLRFTILLIMDVVFLLSLLIMDVVLLFHRLIMDIVFL